MFVQDKLYLLNIFNQFLPSVEFVYPSTILKNHTVFWYFQEVYKHIIGDMVMVS